MMSEQRDTPPQLQTTDVKPLLRPDEIQATEQQRAETLPPRDRAQVERSAGEGMVGTPVQAATAPVKHLTGQAELASLDGTPVMGVTVDLQVSPPAWAGTITPLADRPAEPVSGRYRLHLADGHHGIIQVTAQAGDRLVVEGVGPLEANG
jgi:hypothetical protein